MSTIPHDELMKQRRLCDARRQAIDLGRNLRNRVHVRDGRILIGYEDKYGNIKLNHSIPFSVRASINYINRQRILGTIWETFK